MKHQRQNVRSTQQNSEIQVDPVSIEEWTHNIFAAFIDYRSDFLTDATGPFPVVSSLGN